MNTLWRNLVKAGVIVGVWYLCLYAVGRYRVTQYSVDPQFPYYNAIRDYGQTPPQILWAYFDGAHYLRLVDKGYVDTGTQAFFPVYPLLVRTVQSVTHVKPIASGQIVSLASLVGAVTLMLYMFRGVNTILCVLLFPTSFFLASVYTESFFLFLTTLFFFLLSKKNMGWASLLAGIASGTRLFGILLIFPLLIEYVDRDHNANRTARDYVRLGSIMMVASSGLILYMMYLYYRFHDPLMFLHVQSMFGAERSSDHLVLLPQVLFRYLRMVISADIHSVTYLRVWTELITFSGATYILLKKWRTRPVSWSVYCLASLILPTTTGTLSSIPRYVLVLLPFLMPTQTTKWWWVCTIFLTLCLWIYAGGTFIA